MAANKKGIMALSSVLSLGLVLMFAGLIAFTATGSDLAKAMRHGFGLLGESTDFTIDIENKQQFSDLAMFVADRGDHLGCQGDENGNGKFEEVPNQWKFGGTTKQVITVPMRNALPLEKYDMDPRTGYPGLEDSYLGRYPKCFGAGDTGIRGFQGASGQELGKDMEGIYSREKFNITKAIVLDNAHPETWIEDHLYAAAKSSYDELANQCPKEGGNAGTGRNYIIYFQEDPGGKRTDNWLMSNIKAPGPYCVPGEPKLGTGVSAAQIKYGKDGAPPDPPKKNLGKIKLCPGDSGYIQFNKGDPLNDGEAGAPAIDGNIMKDAETPERFPHIVIEHSSQEDCDVGTSDRSSIKSIKQVSTPEGGDGLKDLVVKAQVQNSGSDRRDLVLRLADESGNELSGGKKAIGPKGSKVIPVRTQLEDRVSGGSKIGCNLELRLYQGSPDGKELDSKSLKLGEHGVAMCGADKSRDAKIVDLHVETGDKRVSPGTSKRLIVDAKIKNTGSKSGNYFKIAMDFNDDRSPKRNKEANKYIEVGKTGTITVRKELNQMDDCKVMIFALVQEKDSYRRADRKIVDLNKIKGAKNIKTGKCTGGGYEGPAKGTQVLIQGPQSKLPNLGSVESFEFRNGGEIVDEPCRGSCGSSTLDPSDSRCQVAFATVTAGSTKRYYASYGLGTRIAKRGGSFSKYDYIARAGDDAARKIYSQFELNGNDVNDPGQLRASRGGQGKNELYGDLLCANLDGKDYANWHLCRGGAEKKKIDVADGSSWSCDTGSGEWQKTGDSLKDSLASPYDRFDPGTSESDALSVESGDLVFRPAKTSGVTDYMIWDIPMDNAKKNSFTVVANFRKPGHLAVKGSRNGKMVTKLDNSGNGDQELYVNNNRIGMSYRTGKNYVFQLKRSGSSFKWLVNGKEVWSGSLDHFDRFTVESWDEYSGGKTTKPVVEIKDVQVNVD